MQIRLSFDIVTLKVCLRAYCIQIIFKESENDNFYQNQTTEQLSFRNTY